MRKPQTLREVIEYIFDRQTYIENNTPIYKATVQDAIHESWNEYHANTHTALYFNSYKPRVIKSI